MNETYSTVATMFWDASRGSFENGGWIYDGLVGEEHIEFPDKEREL